MGDSNADSTNNQNFGTDSHGAITSQYQGNGSADDFNTWTWKQIEAAIVGISNASSDDTGSDDEAKQVSDPTTLYAAANTFEYVKRTLQMVYQSIADQADALSSGDKAPWKGPAADSFNQMMHKLSDNVKANAQVLTGDMPEDDIPAQINAMGTMLWQKQVEIKEMDYWYAWQASQLGAPTVNGLVTVSDVPAVVDLLNSGMRGIITDLSQKYKVTNDGFTAPSTNDPSNQPGNDPGGNKPPPNIPDPGGNSQNPWGNGNPFGDGNAPPPPGNIDAAKFPGSGGGGPVPPPPPPSPFPGAGNVGGGNGPSKSPAPFPDGSIPQGQPPSFPGGSGPQGQPPSLPGGSDPARQPAPFPGGNNIAPPPAGGGSGFVPPPIAPFPGGANANDAPPGNLPAGTSNPFKDNSGGLDPSGLGGGAPSSSPEPFPGEAPGAGGLGGEGDGALPQGLGNLEASAPPSATGGVGQQPPGTPMMPPAGAGSGSQNKEETKSDASGLLSPSPFPGVDGLGDVATEGLLDGGVGAGAGGGGLSGLTPSGQPAGEAAPPPMMPPAGAGSGSQNKEETKSDASGLLNPSEFPVVAVGDVATDGLLDGGVGAGAGGGGLSGLTPSGQPVSGTSEVSGPSVLAEGPAVSSAPPVQQAATAGAGVPMMPPVSPVAAGPQSNGDDKSDASGLLAPQTFPSTGRSNLVADGLLEAGAVAGGLAGARSGLDAQPVRRDQAPTPTPPVNRVARAHQEDADAEDFSAWDTVGATSAAVLPWLLTGDGEENGGPATAVSGPLDGGMGKWRRQKGVDAAGGSMVSAPPVLRSSAAGPTPETDAADPEAATDGETDDERTPAERSSADLLDRRSEPWDGQRPDLLGVLE